MFEAVKKINERIKTERLKQIVKNPDISGVLNLKEKDKEAIVASLEGGNDD